VSYNLIIFYELVLLLVICPFPAILFSLCASYNLIIFYELALLLVICPFPAILFSLSASYNLIIFYELALSLVICPFPRHFIFIITLFISIITFLTKVCHHHLHLSRTSASYYHFLSLSLIISPPFYFHNTLFISIMVFTYGVFGYVV
jgi:hypothetical protein